MHDSCIRRDNICRRRLGTSRKPSSRGRTWLILIQIPVYTRIENIKFYKLLVLKRAKLRNYRYR